MLTRDRDRPFETYCAVPRSASDQFPSLARPRARRRRSRVDMSLHQVSAEPVPDRDARSMLTGGRLHLAGGARKGLAHQSAVNVPHLIQIPSDSTR